MIKVGINGFGRIGRLILRATLEKSEKNIREITLFPLNQNAQDLLMDAPSKVDDNQLKELKIKIDKIKN